MIKNLLVLALIVSAALTWTYFSNTNERTAQPKSQLVTDFTFQDLNNKKHTLYDYKRQQIILHFWATWCAPCVKELPELIELANKNPDSLSVIAVAVADTPKDIEQFLSKTKKRTADNFIIGLDPKKAISKQIYNTTKLPESFIITPSLTLKEKIVGAYEGWIHYP